MANGGQSLWFSRTETASRLDTMWASSYQAFSLLTYYVLHTIAFLCKSKISLGLLWKNTYKEVDIENDILFVLFPPFCFHGIRSGTSGAECLQN